MASTLHTHTSRDRFAMDKAPGWMGLLSSPKGSEDKVLGDYREAKAGAVWEGNRLTFGKASHMAAYLEFIHIVRIHPECRLCCPDLT